MKRTMLATIFLLMLFTPYLLADSTPTDADIAEAQHIASQYTGDPGTIVRDEKSAPLDTREEGIKDRVYKAHDANKKGKSGTEEAVVVGIQLEARSGGEEANGHSGLAAALKHMSEMALAQSNAIQSAISDNNAQIEQLETNEQPGNEPINEK